MPTVALVGPELFPIPPIRGGATEQFIEQVANRLTRWRPVVIGGGDPDLPAHEVQGGVEYYRVPLSDWRKWLYTRYRDKFPFYDRTVADIIRQVKPDLIHVHNRPLLALYLKERLPRIPLILHMHNLYNILGKREKPAPGTRIPVEAFVGCSRFVAETEQNRLGAGAAARSDASMGARRVPAIRHRCGGAGDPQRAQSPRPGISSCKSHSSRYMRPFSVAEVFTGTPGKYVTLKETIKGFRMIAEGECDQLPVQAFYMVGGIEEAFEKAKTLQ